MHATTGPTREELLRLAALFRELSKRDSSLRATANTLGERTIYEVVSNDGRRTDQRTFERLAAQTAESLGLAPRGVPIAGLTAWLALLFEPVEALSKVSYVDQATVTRRDGSQGAAELVLREIDNAAEASAELLERRAKAAAGDAKPPALPGSDDDEYRPATWFPKGMAPRLRMAASKKRKTKRVATRTADGVVCYSVADARRWWPKDVPKST